MKDSLPPQAPDVERTVLGSMLVDGTAAGCAFDLLGIGDFYSGAHRRIFICMKELFDRGVPIDMITLAESLRKRQWLESVGEEPYLAELAESIAAAANMPHYANILVDTAKRRRLIELGAGLAERADAEDADPGALLESAKEELDRIECGTGASRTMKWGVHYNRVGIPDRKPELIGGILRRSHKMLIGAPSKACKSFLAIRLALAIAHGREWLGFTCSPGKVYIANFEIDEGSYMHRVKAVADALGWEIPDTIAFDHLRGYTGDIETLLPAISRTIKGHDIAAVILDPQYKLLRSSTIRNFSENDSSCMAYLYGELDRHFARQGISPIIVSHFAKGTASFKESIDRIAGSGVFARDVDALCTLSSLDTENAYRMEFSLREFKVPDPLSLQWEYPLHQIDPMLDMVPLKGPGGRPGANTGSDDDVVFKAVQDLNGKATQTAVRAAMSGHVSKGRVLDALQRLTVSGKLTISKGERNAIFYHAS